MTDRLSEARRLISLPAGGEGSGRIRYGAAMTLYNAGLIGAEALEVYRYCALLDAEDPAAVLAARGLAPPAPPGPDPAASIRALVEAVDRHLAGLSGQGVAETRAGIATARGAAVVPGGRSHPVVDAWLGPALDHLGAGASGLAGAIAAAAPALDWVSYDLYPRDRIGAGFADGHAFALILGQGAPIAAAGFDLGLFLIAPDRLYRDHAHAAAELYLPLTGPHGWRFGPGTPLLLRPAQVPVWNEPHAPHLTKVGAVPFLALFAWTGDIEAPAYVVDADDWSALEAMRL
jgi:hypothetical protein